VLLYAQNSPQFVIGYYAILAANAVVVPVNPMNKSEELAHYIADSDARTAIAGQELYREVEPHLAKDRIEHCVLACYRDYVRLPTDLKVPEVVSAARIALSNNRVVAWADVMAAGVVPGPHEAGPDDLAVLPYTSGTTGLPKGCMLTHSNILATSTGACFWAETSSETVVLGVLPMFHLTGMQSNMNAPIQLGATSVLMTRWDRDTAAELIQRYRVTGVTGITTMIVDLLANPNLGKYDLSSVRRIGGGGASMPAGGRRERSRRSSGSRFSRATGLTETAAPVARKPVHRPKPQCGGIPYFDTDSRVIDPDTRRERGPNEVGEIITHGPQVFRGYWKQPQATEAAFLEHDGKRFFRTGDLGYYDEEGYFFITDRLKRMINASGFKVWPAEVEAMLYAHPDIQEACVIGTRDAHRGETVKAVVVLKEAARGRASPRTSSPGRRTGWPPTSIRASSNSSTRCPGPEPERSSGASCRRTKRRGTRSEAHSRSRCCCGQCRAGAGGGRQGLGARDSARRAGGRRLHDDPQQGLPRRPADRCLVERGREGRSSTCTSRKAKCEDAAGACVRLPRERVVRAQAGRRAPDVRPDRAAVQGRRQDPGEAKIRKRRASQRRVQVGRLGRHRSAARAQALRRLQQQVAEVPRDAGDECRAWDRQDPRP
jgi:fatty-acyl-CoA synthase